VVAEFEEIEEVEDFFAASAAADGAGDVAGFEEGEHFAHAGERIREAATFAGEKVIENFVLGVNEDFEQVLVEGGARCP